MSRRMMDDSRERDLDAQKDGEVTAEEAAALLRIARPTLLRLIGQGVLQCRAPGAEPRLSRREVVAYREGCAAERRDALARLSRLSEEHDL